MFIQASPSAQFYAFDVCAKSLSVGQAAPAPKSLEQLLATLNERLEIADLVALTKWDSGKPVEDRPRELEVIASAKKQAADRGMDPDDFGRFMEAQIEASKLVQNGLLAEWKAAGKAPDTQRPDLVKEIRPHLDNLQIRLLQQYADFAPFRNDSSCESWLAQQLPDLAKDPLHSQALIRAISGLCNASIARHL